jgi:cold shock CspA family protein
MTTTTQPTTTTTTRTSGFVVTIKTAESNGAVLYLFAEMHTGLQVFIHGYHLSQEDAALLARGDRVEFELGTDRQGRRCGVNCKRVQL